MRKYIKNLLLRLIPKRKSGLALLFVALFFGLLLPLHFASAFSIWGKLLDVFLGLVMGIPMMIFTVILQLILLISVALNMGAAALLSWSANANIPLTHCPDAMANACIVDVGWTFTRDISNMLFILVLVFIAFAHILQLDSYGMKKALPKLIFVALVINFSKVFVGIFVDVAQIIMNTFLGALSAGKIWDQLGGISNVGKNILRSINIFNFFENLNSVIQTITIIIFNFIMAAVLGLYAFLFIIRIIALWFITIMAPLAFAAMILPMTQGLWKKWFKYLLTWSFVGVTALFFVFLGFYLLGTISDYSYLKENNLDLGEDNYGLTGLLQSLLPYITVIVFLYIGFQLAIHSTPAGASFAMKWGGKAMGAVRRNGVGFARRLPGVSRAEEATRKRLESGAVGNAIQKGFEKIPGFNRTKLPKAWGGMINAGMERAVGKPGAYEMERDKKMKAAAKIAEAVPDTAKGNADLRARLNRPAITDQDRHERAAIIETLAKRKELDFKKDDKQAGFLLSEYQKLGYNTKSVYTARPDLAEHLGFTVDNTESIDPTTGNVRIDKKTGKPVQKTASREEAIKIAMNKIESGDAMKIQEEAWENNDVALGLARDKRKFEAIGRGAKLEVRKKIREKLVGDSFFDVNNLSREDANEVYKRTEEMSKSPNWFGKAGEDYESEEEEEQGEGGGGKKKKPKLALPGSEEYQQTERDIKKRTK